MKRKPAKKVSLPRGKKIAVKWIKVSKSGKITAGVAKPSVKRNPRKKRK